MAVLCNSAHCTLILRRLELPLSDGCGCGSINSLHYASIILPRSPKLMTEAQRYAMVTPFQFRNLSFTCSYLMYLLATPHHTHTHHKPYYTPHKPHTTTPHIIPHTTPPVLLTLRFLDHLGLLNFWGSWFTTLGNVHCFLCAQRAHKNWLAVLGEQ